MTNPIEIQHEAETEDYEEIPWSHLVEELGRPRHNLPLLAAGVLVVGVLAGYLVAQFVGGDPPEAASTPPTSVVAPAPPTEAPPQPATAPTLAAPTPTSVAPAVLFSEADLMAVASDHERTIAAARAEWFVRDFFTVDESSGPSAQVTEVLTAVGASRPTSPTSYVEWARTLSVEPTALGVYDVSVVFQVLAAEGDDFARHPARAVRVMVTIDDSLGSGVTGLPRPTRLTTVSEAVAAGQDMAPPADVLDEATLRAVRFGSEPTLVRSWLDAGTWHIVMTVNHGGAAWPLLVDVPQPGSQP